MCLKPPGQKMNRSTLSSQNSISAKSTLKFNLSQNSIDESSKVMEEGQQFASAVASLASGNYSPEKKQYPPFKTTFWEEPRYNPALSQADQECGFNAHHQEESSHWHAHGHLWAIEKRFIPSRPQNETGPTKREEYPRFYENGQKYYGRKREILPLLRAKIYTRPLDRCDEEVQKRNRNPAAPGPGTYDLGDPWQPKSFGTLGHVDKPSPFMESKTKRDINEFYGLHDSSPNTSHAAATEARGNRRELTTHHAKTRSLLPNSPYGLINMSQKEMNSLGVTGNGNGNTSNSPEMPHTPQKPQTHAAGTSVSLYSQTPSRPHTSGAVFGKSVSEPIATGVPPNIHFIRIQQPSGPMIVPIPNQSDSCADPSLEGLSDELQLQQQLHPIPSSVIETWSRPQSRAERSNLFVEAIPLQLFSSIDSPQQQQQATEGTGTTETINANRIQRASFPSSSPATGSPKKHKAPPRQQQVSSTIASAAASSPSPPTIPLTATELPPHSPIRRSQPQQEKLFESPKLSKRSLSYEHLQKERRIQNKLSSLRSNSSNLSSSPSTPLKVPLFLSEKMALTSPEGREANRRTAATARVAGGGRRSGNEEFYSSLTSRSQEILDSLGEGKG